MKTQNEKPPVLEVEHPEYRRGRINRLKEALVFYERNPHMDHGHSRWLAEEIAELEGWDEGWESNDRTAREDDEREYWENQ